MNTLSEFIPRIRALGGREAIRWSTAYSTRTATYSDLYGRIGAAAAFIEEQGLRQGDRLLIQAENRLEWVALFWACVATGVHAVPVDPGFSPELTARIRADSGAAFVADSLVLDAIARLPARDRFAILPAQPDDIVEIIYTSGTTGEPKGIVHRHRNVCANLTPFDREIARYRRLARPFQPIRTMNLLPLSHMFGQSMGLYIPVCLQGAVVFTGETHPGTILRLAHENRISIVACVPRILALLRTDIERRYAVGNPRLRGIPGILERCWMHRRIHAAFGWKFWAFVVGGAHVDPEMEEFWERIGFLVVQGYGLTEASPVVAVNHPFSSKRGSLGMAVPGQEIRIAEDGEILVRGESVAASTDAEGWLHTGDLGAMDAAGRLYFHGRKKDVIVTSEGLNVSPEDVEAVLNRLPEVQDSAVVAIDDQVHAAIIVRTPGAAADAVRKANARLETHQQIRRWSEWPDADFPRTASTLKIQRRAVAERIRSGRIEAKTETLPDPATLSSLERVELLSALEARHGIEIDEEEFSRASTAEDLQEFLRRPAAAHAPIPLSAWPLNPAARSVRNVFQGTVALPLFRRYLPLTVQGVENLAAESPPMIVAANHTSHLDTAAIYTALPPAWRKKLSPAMQADYFRPHFEPAGFPIWQRLWSRTQYCLARLIYNAYPLPQKMTGVRRALAYTADVVQRGYCPLIFPEGLRSPDGSLQPFHPGVGLMAVRLRIPVLPVRIDGLFEVFPAHASWPRRGPVRVTLGAPLTFAPDTPLQEAADAVRAAIAALQPGNY